MMRGVAQVRKIIRESHSKVRKESEPHHLKRNKRSTMQCNTQIDLIRIKSINLNNRKINLITKIFKIIIRELIIKVEITETMTFRNISRALKRTPNHPVIKSIENIIRAIKNQI